MLHSTSKSPQLRQDQNTAHFTLEPHRSFLCSQTNLTATCTETLKMAQVSRALQSACGCKGHSEINSGRQNTITACKFPVAASPFRCSRNLKQNKTKLLFYKRDKDRSGNGKRDSMASS